MIIKNYYSQKDPRWANIKVGTSNSSIENIGCFLCCLAMISNEYTPEQLNQIAIDNNCYSKGKLLISGKLVKLFGVERVDKQVNETDPCILVTDFYKDKGVSTHFVVLLPNGKIIDPLDEDPKPKKNIYVNHIISIRFFNFAKIKNNGENTMFDFNSKFGKFIKELDFIPFNDYKDIANAKINDVKELVTIGLNKWIKSEFRDTNINIEFDKIKKDLEEQIITLKKRTELLKERCDELNRKIEKNKGLNIGTILKSLFNKK